MTHPDGSTIIHLTVLITITLNIRATSSHMNILFNMPLD